MRLVEQHVIKRADYRFKAIDRAAFASKNLYNKALYVTRQAFFQDGSYPRYPRLYHQMKDEPEYAALPRKVAQWVLKQVCAAWDSCQEGLAAYGADPAACLGRPRLPQYKHKQQGRNMLGLYYASLERAGLAQPDDLPIGLEHHGADQTAERPAGARHPAHTQRLLCRRSDLQAPTHARRRQWLLQYHSQSSS